MTDTPKKLSDTARAVLALAATRDDHLVQLPRLPVAAARSVIRSLLTAGLVEEVPAPIEDAAYNWRAGDDGTQLMVRATASGLARIGATQTTPDEVPTGSTAAAAPGVGAAASEAGPELPAPAGPAQAADRTPARGGLRRDSLRDAARALLEAWDDGTNQEHDISGLESHIAALRAALAKRVPTPTKRVVERPDTKKARVLAMLRREEGASGRAIAEAMGWASHTVRGFLAGLNKKGITVEVLERVRQVGPDKAGAKGSYTVYRVAE